MDHLVVLGGLHGPPTDLGWHLGCYVWADYWFWVACMYQLLVLGGIVGVLHGPTIGYGWPVLASYWLWVASWVFCMDHLGLCVVCMGHLGLWT